MERKNEEQSANDKEEGIPPAAVIDDKDENMDEAVAIQQSFDEAPLSNQFYKMIKDFGSSITKSKNKRNNRYMTASSKK